MTVIPNGPDFPADLLITVKNDNSFLFTPMTSGATYFSVSSPNGFSSISGSGIVSASIDFVDNTLLVDGTNMQFSAWIETFIPENEYFYIKGNNSGDFSISVKLKKSIQTVYLEFWNAVSLVKTNSLPQLHPSHSQLFYAFALGLVFGYVYLKTGKLRYSIGLHMLINFIGSVVGPFFLEKLAVLDTMETMDMAALESILPWLLGFGAYVLVLIGLAVTGLVLLCINKRRVSFAAAALELPKESRFKTVYMNAGMILLVIGCMALIIANVI